MQAVIDRKNGIIKLLHQELLAEDTPIIALHRIKELSGDIDVVIESANTGIQSCLIKLCSSDNEVVSDLANEIVDIVSQTLEEFSIQFPLKPSIVTPSFPFEISFELCNCEDHHSEDFKFRSICNQTKIGNQSSVSISYRLLSPVFHPQRSQADVGTALWPSSLVLCRWISKHSNFVSRCKHILEIGSGVGLCGLQAGKLAPDATVTLTDFNSVVLANLRYNARINTGRFRVQHLDWANKEEVSALRETDEFELILGSDLICCDDDADNILNLLQLFLVRGSIELTDEYELSSGPPSRLAVLVLPSDKSRYGIARWEYLLSTQSKLTYSVEPASHLQEKADEALTVAAGYACNLWFLY
jgi:Lysine methyltransferase